MQVRRGSLQGMFPLLALLASVDAAVATQDLVPRTNGCLPVRDHYMELAPIVVVAVPTSISLVPSIQAVREQDHLVQVQADVELVIRGDLKPGKHALYYFTHALTGAIGSEIRIEPGKRFILFLYTDAGVLRTIKDMAGTEIRVFSGKHSASSLPQAAGPSETIATILLTPGTDFDTADFAQSIHESALHMSNDVRPLYLANLLKNLVGHYGGEVGANACLSLSQIFYGQDSCLDVMHHRKLDPKTMQEIDAAIAQRPKQDKWLTQVLVTSPLSILTYGDSSPIAEYLEKLRLLTEHRNPNIRSLAWRILSSILPNEHQGHANTPH